MEDLIIETFERIIEENKSKCKVITKNYEQLGVHKNQKRAIIYLDKTGKISNCVIIDATNN